MALPKGTVAPTQDAVAEEAAQIENVASEVPGFDTGEDKSGELIAANDAGAQETTQVSLRPASGGALVTNVKAVGLSESAREIVFAEDDEDDLKGLAVDNFSFPSVTQKDGMYKIGEEMLGAQFNCIIQSTGSKFLYKDKEEPEDSKEPKLAYSYDEPGTGAVDTTGRLIAEIREEWVKAGVKPENIVCIRYLDVKAEIQDGEHHGSLCTIQVPPTSIPVVSGKLLELKKRFRSLRGIVVNFSAPKAVGSGQRKFYPFHVRFVREVSKA